MISATDFRELLKTESLVKHYYATKINDASVTVIKFLVWHYLTDDLNDNDNKQDKELPFKSASGEDISNLHVINTLDFQTTAVSLFIVKKDCYLKFSDSGFVSQVPFFVWHPPQIS